MLNVQQYGAQADGCTSNTTALQRAIDACGDAGGGTLLFPPGRYVTGTLVLRDRVHLHLEAGAVLLGSTRLDAYPLYDPPPVRFSEDQEGLRTLLFAHGVSDIRLTGAGTIDGRGPDIERPSGMRAGLPRNIWFAKCCGVRVEGLRLRHSGFWMQHYLKCTGVRLHGLQVYNHGSCNNDGCDIDCCRDVVVSDCTIDSHDDALCMKSGNDRPTENVVISNCLTRTHCNHIKTGTESNGGFRNITITNIQMVPSTVRQSDPNTGGADYRGACGIALGCVDGGMLENISVSHVQMDRTRVPFFVKFGDRGQPIHGTDTRLPVQCARGIRLSDITARCAGPTGGYIMGLPEAPVRDVRIERCELEFEGGGNADAAEAAVPLKRDCYPSCDAFGMLPAYGLFVRDARKVTLHGLGLHTRTPDARPGLRWERVRGMILQDIRDTQTEECLYETV